MTLGSGEYWSGFNAARFRDAVAPRPLVLRAIEAAGAGRGRTAVEVGSGSGTETRALLEAGWEVHAYDADADGLARTAAAVGAARLHPHPGDVRSTTGFPDADLIYSGYTLPWLGSPGLPSVWGRMRAALRPGGVIAADLFGDRDDWAGRPDTAHLTREQVERLLDGLDVIALDEVEEDGTSTDGPKHWHRFEVIARRPDLS